MSKIVVSVRQIDGGLFEFDAQPDLLQRHSALERQGLRGKQLINTLFSDDWGPPPTSVSIRGKTKDGKLVDIHIPYL